MAMRVKAAVDRAAGAVSTLLDTASQKVAAVKDGSVDSHPIYRSSGGAGVDGSYGPSGHRDEGPRPQQYRTTGGAGVEGSYGPGESCRWPSGAVGMRICTAGFGMRACTAGVAWKLPAAESWTCLQACKSI